MYRSSTSLASFPDASASLATVPPSWESLSCTSDEFKRLRTWATEGSLVRSHSQAVTREGLPNFLRNSCRALLSHTWVALSAKGDPWNFSPTPRAWQMMSRVTSASGRRR